MKCKKSRYTLLPSPKEILATDAALPENKRNGEFRGGEDMSPLIDLEPITIGMKEHEPNLLKPYGTVLVIQMS